MKKCEMCKKIMTDDDEKAVMNDFHYTFAKDWDFDRVCDSCDAKHHAQGCVRVIAADMQKYRGIASKDKITRPGAFLENKLKTIRDIWIKYFTEKIDVKGNENWKNEFIRYVENKTEYLKEVRLKDMEKKEKVNY